MDLVPVPESATARLVFTLALTTILALTYSLWPRRIQLPDSVPTLIPGWPIFGSWEFFTQRLDFYVQATSKSKSRNFSFWVGNYPLIALTGTEDRTFLFDSKDLNLFDAYNTLFGGIPGDENHRMEKDYFSTRIVNLLKGGVLRKRLPKLIQDIQVNLDELEASPHKIIQPFKTIYEIVFQLTMRTVGCEEIADDANASRKVLNSFETLADCGDKPLSIMYPGLWTLHKVRRLIAGIKVFTTIDKIVKDRKRTGRTEEDAIQFLINQGDSSMKCVEFVMGALFAGQVNSGIGMIACISSMGCTNQGSAAAWMVLYLSRNKYWHDQVMAEIKSVSDKYTPDKNTSLRDKLARLPIEAWESEFHVIDLCLKETIRLSLNGVWFRQNLSGHDLKLDTTGEVIPNKVYVVYHMMDSHLNPDIFLNPYEWDPSRYLPGRAEDQKERYAWTGWGAGRHPCVGMRFAQLEMNMLVAFWFAYFESEVVTEQGNSAHAMPKNDFNANSAKKPKEKSFIKYWTRTEGIRD